MSELYPGTVAKYDPGSDEALVRSILNREPLVRPFVNRLPAERFAPWQKKESVAGGKAIELSGDAETLIEQKKALDYAIAELRAQSEELKGQIVAKIEEAAGKDSPRVTATCGSWRVTYNETERRTLDTEALKRDGLYEKYVKTKSTRYMRISRIQESAEAAARP